MSTFSAFLAGPWGVVIAIAGMTVVTFLCRIAGAAVMTRVRVTPRVERGLRALPGSVIVATISPLIVNGGWTAAAAVGIAVALMALTKRELPALVGGLAAVALIRAFGV